MELLQCSSRAKDPVGFIIMFVLVIIIGSLFFEKVPKDITHPKKDKIKK